MRVFKTKTCARSIDGEIDDEALAEAVREIEQGLVDATLGAGLVKKRLARPGQGKRGGYRTLIAYKAKERAVFVFAFAKNETENVKKQELETLKDLAEHLLSFSDRELARAIAERELVEVPYAATGQGEPQGGSKPKPQGRLRKA